MIPMMPESSTIRCDAEPRAGMLPVLKPRKPFWPLLGALLVLAGCAARPPAPVVDRSTPAPGPVVQQPASSSGSVSRSAPATTDRRPAGSGTSSAQRPAPAASAQTAPVRSGQVEARPLSQAQAAQASPPSSASASPAGLPPVTLSSETPTDPLPASRSEANRPAPVSPEVVRGEPSGLKQPYSEAALARARQGEAAAAASRAPGPVATAPTTAPTVRPDPGASAASQGAAAPKSPDDAGSFSWPAPGKVLQAFAEPSNMGIVLEGRAGEPVLAAADGRVIFSGTGPRGYGNLLIVKHEDDLLSVYGHNRSLLVKEGDSVTRGQRIAEIGNSDAERTQLRFEIRRQGKPVDPMRYLAPR
jgi:lipoprotein NlpD